MEKVLARVGDWSKEQMNKVEQSGEATFMLGAVIMDCRGLVDPQNKSFGNVLPLEVQVKILFWVECFYTMDQRKKVVQEFKGLPKCDLTGLPQHLGEDRHWNQVVVRLHAPRRNSCHDCHRLMDHRLSVSEKKGCFGGDGLKKWLRVFFFSWFQIGMMAEMARQPPNLDNLMNEGIAFVIDRFKSEIPNCPVGKRPVMIGRRKPAYDTIDKVMKRLDLIINVMSAMNFIVVDVQ